MEGKCNPEMWDLTSEIRRMRPQDVGLSLGSKANATTRCRIQPWDFRRKKLAVFVLHPTNRTSMAQGLFKVGPTRGQSPHAPGISKYALSPVGIPLKGAPQAPGDKPNPSEEG